MEQKPHALTTYRSENGLSLETFGSLVGALKGTVFKWENGVIPRKEYMAKIQTVTEGKVTSQDWYAPVEAVS